MLFVTRFSTMAVLVVLALAFKDRVPDERGMLVLAAAALAGHLVEVPLSAILGEGSESLALGMVAAVADGAFIAVVQLMLLNAIARAEAAMLGALVGMAYLIAEVCYFAMLMVPSAVAPVLTYVGEVLVLCSYIAYRFIGERGGLGDHTGASDCAANKRVEPNPASPADGSDAPGAREASTGVAIDGVPLWAFAAFICSLTLTWGLVAQSTGTGAIAFFDTTSEIIMVAVRVVIVLALVYLGARLTVRVSSLTSLAIWVAGIMVVGLLWGLVDVGTSGLVLKSGLYFLQASAMVVALNYARDHGERCYFVVGLVACALMGAHISRAILFGVLGGSTVTSVTMVHLMSVACGLLCLALLLMVVVNLAPVSHAVAPAQEPVDDTAGENREIEFMRRFERFCAEMSLSPRERDVLFETLHGYTVDAAAANLEISRETVKTYLSRIYSRAGVNSRQELLRILDRPAQEWGA